ncbi:MAG: UDP-3-O-(3-hydroxymyristoyl)glucosamine N-acyltransferase [Gammaproteobacteria bacterium]
MTQFTLEELANKLDAKLQGDPATEIRGIETLDRAQSGDLSFLFNPKYRHHLQNTQASAVILSENDLENCATNALISDNPYFTYSKAAAFFSKVRTLASKGIHPTAVVGEDCDIHESVAIGPYVVIGDRVTIDEGATIGAHAVIQDDVVIGKRARIWPRVTLCHDVALGDETEVHSGAVIGSDGFGLAQNKGEWHKIPQMGKVILGNKVEVGANTTIDRGSIGNTIISDGTKLDNQIQIAHNVRIGQHTVIAGCVGVAGSTTIGSHCQIGGGAGVTGHINIADQVGIAAMSMISKSIDKPGHYTSRGMGLQTLREWQKSAALLRRLDRWIGRVRKLETQIGTQGKASNNKQQNNNTSNLNRVNETMGKELDVNEIVKLLPHRYPFLLVDKVLDYELGKSLVAVKNVTANEEFFVGHFPQKPVMPGVLIVEALAQAGGVLAYKSAEELYPEEDILLYLVGVDNARFKRVVQPGDQLRLEVEVIKTRGAIWRLKGVASVDGQVACTAELMSAK